MERSGTGEGGIRTLGALLGHGALAKRCFQPLSHLTKMQAAWAYTGRRDSEPEYAGEISFANFQLLTANVPYLFRIPSSFDIRHPSFIGFVVVNPMREVATR